MALRKPFVLNTTEGYHEELPVADTLDVGSIEINASGTGIDMNSKKITEVGDGSDPADGVNLAQVQALVASGNIFKEPVFAAAQLINGASGGIAALGALFFAAIPVVGDEITITDGTNTRTYDFVANIAGELADTDVSIETDAATAMARFVLRVNADAANTYWDLEFHAPGEFNTDGEIHVQESKTPVDTLSTSRIYGTFTTQAELQVITFSDGATADQYNEGTAAAASTTDPAGGRFGLGRAEATLIDGEVHLALDENTQHSWEDSAQIWNQISGVGAIPDAESGSGGSTKGLATFDEDKGLQVVANGIAEVRIEASKGIQFESGGGIGVKIDDTPDTLDVDADGLKVTGLPSTFKINGTAVSAGVTGPNLDTLVAGASSDAQSLHTHDNLSSSGHSHAHSEITSVGVNDHHNQSHAIDGGDHTASGLTAGHVLTASGASAFGFAALPTAIDEAKRLEETLTTATDVTANADPVYINGNDTVGKARADTDAKARVIGVIKSGAGAAPTSVDVIRRGICAGILVGATANTPYFLQETGGIGTSIPGATFRVIRVGYAINATDLEVLIHDYGKKA